MIAVQLLGPLRVRVDDHVLGPREFAGLKTKRLFEILVLLRGRAASKEQLAELLWDDDAPQSLTGTLGTYVSVLRRRLGLDALIETSPNAYRYVPGSADLDLDRFDRLTALAGTVGPAQGRRHLEAAIGLVRGDVVEDEPYAAWAEEHRTVYRKKIGETLVRAADAALACRDHDAAVSHAERALAMEPLSEAAARALMLAQYALGRQGEAMATFDRVRGLLGQELGVRPMEETWKLVRDIATHETLGSLLPAPAWDEPPATIDLRGPHVPLLGRSAEVGAVASAIDRARSGQSSLVMVEGEAGMGKTRLMSELTDDLDGVRVGRTRCSRLEQDLPFVPLLRALRSAAPTTVGKVLGERTADLALTNETIGSRTVLADKTRTIEGIADLVDTHGPVVLVIDDVHWADAATITALAYLCAGDHALVVLAGMRPSLVTPEHPLYWLEPRTRLSLGALSADDLAPLEVPGLHARTRGHPLLVAEWLQAQADGALDELPVRLGPWIREQAGSGDLAQQLLVTAAFVDEPFQLDDLSHVLGPLTTELVDAEEKLIRCGLLELTDGGLQFRHPLLRDALAASVSPSRRRLLERALANRLLESLVL